LRESLARFYDTASDLEIKRIEDLLKSHGIGYWINQVTGAVTVLLEFIVAEEYLIFAQNSYASEMISRAEVTVPKM
jgi:hypothetical protein